MGWKTGSDTPREEKGLTCKINNIHFFFIFELFLFLFMKDMQIM